MVETANTPSNGCYNLYAAGEVLLGNGTWIDLNGYWLGGYAGSLSVPYSGDVTHTSGVNNACNYANTVCAGYTDTSAP